MQWKYTLAHLTLVGVVAAFFLTPLMVGAAPEPQIAFMSHRDGNWEIYVMDADGDNQRNLTNNPDDNQYPAWSPDGKQIAFVFDRNDRDWNRQIYVMDADGDNQRNLSNNGFDEWAPSWSPDGKRIALVSNRDGNYSIYVMAVDGGNPRRLTRGWDRSPSWSPDGKRIAFSSNRDGNWEIYVIDADGGNPRRLTNDRHDDHSPSWSPDGKRIVFSSNRDWHLDVIHAWPTDEIYVMDANGGNQQGLTENFVYEWAPSWSPDGKRIAFGSERDGNAEIYVMDADGGNPQNVTNHPNHDFSPTWYIPPFSVAPAGKALTAWGWVKQVDQ